MHTEGMLKDNALKGKTILVTGGGTGLGKSMGKYFLDNTIELANGSNAVNTSLVDFRGFDTMGEITVLVISLLYLRPLRGFHPPRRMG